MLPLPPADSRKAAALALIPTGAALLAALIPSTGAYWAAWVALIPLAVWAGAAPAWRRFTGMTFLTLWAVQFGSMIWLRHVYPPLGWLGLVFLTAYFALFPTLWALAARRLLPGETSRALPLRMLDMLALAGLWVALEWAKGRLFTGCPWMPLAATQWKVTPMLALCAYAGPSGTGFAIVLFNLGLARYARRLTERNTESVSRTGLPATPWSGMRLCPEFYLGVTPVFLSLFLFYRDAVTRRATDEVLFTAAAVQTDFDPNAKWESRRATENLQVVVDATRAAAKLAEGAPAWESGMPAPAAPSGRGPDLILWPEAALPFRIGRADYDRFLAKLSAETRTPLLVGAVKEGVGGYYNGIFQISPRDGVRPDFYAKRHLVPFGEYVPFANILPLRKVVPIAEDSLRGENHDPLEVTLRDGRTVRLGGLVCYEDIFPELARDMAARGADALLVVTNDAWYGREAGAYQHAATCAVLAASTGLPVVRCGNAGWSGVITPLGRGEPVLDASGSVYFRGAGRFDVRGTPGESRTPTPFVVYGDRLAPAGALLFAFALLRRRFARQAAPNEMPAASGLP